ncbi:lipoprotein-releasing ABC transporter permease subunit [Bartonella sp. TP]|uniref:lipoprotein-releasing ABC transporter permease subunit n=1 Tax=Bartonella sp. TP TaxID=3057550 RepID=UPI0025AFF0C5|nr:lipoprotein-releasing ABC transporter permease subunit [Bartonella sp. TP]WJW79942.1 lipoprotein-releasing ABC transporter permease subunit [Bartonella sp. TP]
MRAGLFSLYEWKIALRYMIPSKKQTFTSVISCISLLGIIVGVWALIVVTSVMNGFRSELLDRILGVNGHIIIQSADTQHLSDYLALTQKLRALEGIKSAAPVIEEQALAQVPGLGSSGAIIRGVLPEDLSLMSTITRHVKAGDIADFTQANSVVIGAGMAKKFGLTIGDNITVLSPTGDVTPFGVNPRTKSYKIAAIYEVGMYEYDSAIIFMPLKEAQSFFNYGDKVLSIEIFLNNPDKVEFYKKQIATMIAQPLNIIGWEERNKAFFSALTIERNAMFIILSLIVLVAALNIISGLVMLVKDKGKDIAILRTMGAANNSILRIFIMAGMVIGVLGTLIGLALGIATCLNIDNLQRFISWLFGVNVFNPELYFLAKLPAKLDWIEVFTISFVTLLLSFLATLIPAWSAAKLDPIAALRYE